MFRQRDAFTLLEMSIVLTIIAVIIAGGAVTFSASLKQRQYDQTKEKLVVLQNALRDYWRTFGRLPCPGASYSYNATSGGSNGNFGKEAQNKATCDGTPSADFVYNLDHATSTTRCNYTGVTFDDCVYGGMVPVRTLQLPDDYAFDGWGRRFQYVVNSDFTTQDAAAAISITADSGGTSRIIIKTSTTTAAASIPKTNSAAYALVSFGMNGHGAYPRTTSGDIRVSSGSDNDMEKANCHCDATTAATTFDNIFYQSPYKTNTSSTIDTFDDMVVFGTRGTLYSATQ